MPAFLGLFGCIPKRLPFAGCPAAFATHHFSGHETTMAVKPAAEHHLARQRAGHAREVNKHKLRHILCQMRITIY